MRKKSRYKPRNVNTDPIGGLLHGATAVASLSPELVRLRSVNHACLDEMSKGRGTLEHMNVLLNVMNMTETLALRGHGSDWLPEIRAAQKAVRDLAFRSVDIGRYVFKAEELTAVNLAFEIHDAQLDACTIREYNESINTILDAINNKRTTIIPKPKAVA